MAIEIDEPTFVETILHYGLLLGAVFQLVCIFAVIFIPQSQNDQERVVEEPRPSSNTNQPQQLQSHSKKNKKRKEISMTNRFLNANQEGSNIPH